jgi:2-phosphosulfolactate phosphatase
MPAIHVHLLPSLIPPGALRGGVAVVVDVLRATTVMAHALASGCEAVIPCLEIDDARRVASELPAGTAILGGERGGLPIEGFDLGNSPASYTPEACRGKTLVMTTTNGTRAILASLEAERVYVAAFANLGATAEEVAVQCLKADHGKDVHIVCSGTEGHVSLEDSLLAGALISRAGGLSHEVLEEGSGEHAALGNDSAYLALSQWFAAERRLAPRGLAPLLSLGRGGQNVRRIGLDADIADAARIDVLRLVAELSRDPLRIVAVS